MKQRPMIQVIFTMGLVLTVGLGLGITLPATAPPALAQGGVEWPDIELVEIENGFDSPVHITHPGDGSDRIFIVEQDGVIKIIKSGQTLVTPFLDIQNIVQSPQDGTNRNEEGLLSLAFPPDYGSKPLNERHFYVYYTNVEGGASGDNQLVIARYFLLSDDVADPNSEEIVLTIDHPDNRNHNGGQLAFGPNDGYLYLATGDGGSGGDPPNNAQTITTLLGKMLRIDVETGNPATYTTPNSNPFFGATPGRDEIWALGLRNPWRFSFDRQTHDLYIGDVGQNAYEEIDFQPAASSGGENYGWRCKEGFHDFNMSGNCPTLTLEPPIYEYAHDVPGADNCSVTGGFVYRGQNYPAMQGIYFYADACTGRVWGLQPDGAMWENMELLDTPYLITTFGEDEAGNLYLAARAGAIYQITAPTLATPDLSTSTKNVTPAVGDPGQTFTYTISLINSGDPLTQTVYLTDTLPAGLAYVPDSLTAPFGAVDDSGPELLWNGLLNPTSTIQITYQVTATGVETGALQNQAIVRTQNLGPYTLTRTILISPQQLYLPLILK